MGGTEVRSRGQRWLGGSSTAQPDPEGGALGPLGAMLRRAGPQLLQSLVDTSTTAIFIKDVEGRYLLVNQRYEELFQISRTAIVGKTDLDVFPRERAEGLRASDRQVLAAGAALESEEQVDHADGVHTYLAIRAPLHDASGRPCAVCGIATDVTERKRAEAALREAEERLRHAQKMEAVGHLAGGVAHDFNNLLVAILGHAQLLLKRLPTGDRLREHAEQIQHAGDRAAALTRQLLAFSRKQVLQPRVIDINGLVGDTSKLLRRVIREDVELVIALDPELGHVRADPGQMVQVLLNLATNARDAMPRGGRLTITTREVALDDAFAQAVPGVRPGRHVVLTVADTGCGMSESTQARLFEPFFTTKAVGKGTGLGLSSVYGIVRQSGGEITVDTGPERGTSFHIYLPRVDEPVETSPPSPLPELDRGTGLILVAEDEAMVRLLVTEVLTDHGYDVLAVATPRDAMTLAERCAEPIDVLLTDVVMPGMNGPDLAAQIAARHPETRPIFMSGHVGVPGGTGGFDSDLERATDFLQKPFASDVLLQKVREVMTRPR